MDLPGKTDEQIRTEYAEFRKERAAHKEDLPYPEGGECGCDVARRVMPKIKQICQREENRVAIVTHGRRNTLGVCRYSSYRSGEQIKIWNRPRKYKFYPFDLTMRIETFLFWSVLMILLIWSLIRSYFEKTGKHLWREMDENWHGKKIRNWQFSYSQPFV